MEGWLHSQHCSEFRKKNFSSWHTEYFIEHKLPNLTHSLDAVCLSSVGDRLKMKCNKMTLENTTTQLMWRIVQNKYRSYCLWKGHQFLHRCLAHWVWGRVHGGKHFQNQTGRWELLHELEKMSGKRGFHPKVLLWPIFCFVHPQTFSFSSSLPRILLQPLSPYPWGEL